MTTTLTTILPTLALLSSPATAGGGTPIEPSAPLAIEYRAAAPAPLRHYSRRSFVRLEIFAQNLELGELEFDPNSTPSTDIKDVERDRVGFRASFGKPAVRGYFHLFGEEWNRAFSTNQDFDMFGVGGGVLGEPAAGAWSADNVRLVIPYRAGFNVAWGDDDSGVVDESSVYVEFEGEVGVGVYVWGLRPMLGLYASSLTGYIDVDQIGFGNDEVEYDGVNAGAFAELRYRHDRFPLFASARVQGGDVEGIVLSFGASF